MIHLRLSGIEWESIVDGPGIRCTVFAQGCDKRCPGCHNPQTWPFSGGFLMDSDAIIARMQKNPLLSGITLSGGEPFCQAAAFADLAKKAKDAGFDVQTYTGNTFRELLILYDGAKARHNDDEANAIITLIDNSDYIIDGPFIQGLREYDVPYKGSANQRRLSRSDCLRMVWSHIGYDEYALAVKPYDNYNGNMMRHDSTTQHLQLCEVLC